jgi:phenylacetic acid degradation operon negative regulatory protein
MNANLDTFFRSVDTAPLRAWSLIVTIYGDCVMPRGGELWLGTLTELLVVLGVEPGSARTAMSRLARDGFLERRRVGRTSHYALSARALALSREAERLIYRNTPPEADHGWDMIVLPSAGADRRALADLGYEALVPGVFVRPRHPGGAEHVDGAIHLCAAGDDAALARAVYPLDEIAARYEAFVAGAGRLESAAGAAGALEALAFRIALVHAFRRIVLRDPHLPREALPPDWPASAAYAAFARLYKTLRPASDAWLEQNARNAEGLLPPAAACERFTDGPPTPSRKRNM